MNIASNKCIIPDVIFLDDFLFENTIESMIEKLEYVFKSLKGLYNNIYSNSYVPKRFNLLYKSLI